MRINEDYFDDIEIERDISVPVSRDKRNNSEFERVFEFRASEMPKHKNIEWYTSRIVRFRKRFSEMLSRLPFIQDYNGDFSINIGVSGVTNTYIELDGDYGFDIMHPLYRDLDYDITSDSNLPWFELGLNVRLETLEQLRRVLINLWKCFEICYKDAFGNYSQAKSITYHNPATKNFYIFIDWQSLYAWQERDPKSQKMFLNMLRCLYPDKKPLELKPEVERFIERGKSSVSEFLEQWRTERYDSYDDNIIKQSDKIEIVDGRLIFHRTKPLELNQQNIKVMNEKRVPFVIKDLKKIIFFPFLTIYSKPEDYFKLLKDWIEKYAPEVKEIDVYVDGDALFPYAGKTVDLTELFPGFKTLVKKKRQRLVTYYNSKPRHADNAKCYVPRKDFEVKFVST